MQQQSDHRIPRTGEAWRHFKGGLYTVIGTGVDDNGWPMVIYTPFGGDHRPPLFVQGLSRFLQEVPNTGGFPPMRPRFEFEREPSDWCAYIADSRKIV